ncbi:MAG: hypothetical protein ACM3Q4_15885 [Acidobacteriota bacterium]
MKTHALFLAILLAGCTYGYDSEVNVTRSTSRTYGESAYFPEVFFDDAQASLTKPYEQLGLIEVKGASDATGEVLLHALKSKGAVMGADAIVNVRQHYISRERGERISELLSPRQNKPEMYETIALTGVAIRYKTASRPADTLFRKRAQ